MDWVTFLIEFVYGFLTVEPFTNDVSSRHPNNLTARGVVVDYVFDHEVFHDCLNQDVAIGSKQSGGQYLTSFEARDTESPILVDTDADTMSKVFIVLPDLKDTVIFTISNEGPEPEVESMSLASLMMFSPDIVLVLPTL